jgi:hypothetical protein
MRKTYFLLAISAALVLLISSCKKNKGDKSVQHLLSAVYKAGNDSMRYDYVYDESNRLTKIYYKALGQTTATSYLITYSDNQVTMLYYNPFLPGLAHKDSIVLQFDQRNMLVKRIGLHTNTYSAPIGRNYSYDTTTYEYNSQRIITNTLYTSYDSTWSNPLSPQTDVRRTTGSVIYTISNNNLAQSLESNTTIQVIHSTSSTTTNKLGSELTRTFDYSAAYLNRTDFTNSVLLNEANPISELPIASQFRNLPNKVTFVSKTKDANGTVTNTVTSTTMYQFTYGSDGLVATKTDSNSPTGVMRYTYGQ